MSSAMPTGWTCFVFYGTTMVLCGEPPMSYGGCIVHDYWVQT